MINTVGLLNYGVGNLGSIQRMIQKVGGESVLITSSKDFHGVKKIILPGVGHFAEGVRALQKCELWDPLLQYVEQKDAKLLGICLGMQLLCKQSEEGNVEGLGLIDANVEKFHFPNNRSLKVPHMGWNTLRTCRVNSLLPMDEEERRFYFVHSYKVVLNNQKFLIGESNYGGEFCAAFQQGNVFGVQFHPEKSHRFGMALMKRFVEL